MFLLSGGWYKRRRATTRTCEEERRPSRHRPQTLAAPTTSKPQSWAQAAQKNRKVVAPATNKSSEIIVVPDINEAEIRQRKGSDTLRAVKAKTATPGVFEGTRRLPDGSTVLRVAAGKEDEVPTNDAWLPVVFGRKAKGGLHVLVKGIPNRVLSAVTDNEIREACGAFHATRREGAGGYGTLLCRVPGLEAATKDGIRLRSQVFRCEPFCKEGRARQCGMGTHCPTVPPGREVPTVCKEEAHRSLH